MVMGKKEEQTKSAWEWWMKKKAAIGSKRQFFIEEPHDRR